MKFINGNTIKTKDGNTIVTDMLTSIEIASKTDKRALRTTFLTYLFLEFNEKEDCNEIDRFLANDANKLVKEYINKFASFIKYDYVKDLKIEDFEITSNFVEAMDDAFIQIHSATARKINNYNNQKIYSMLSNR